MDCIGLSPKRLKGYNSPFFVINGERKYGYSFALEPIVFISSLIRGGFHRCPSEGFLCKDNQ